MQARHGPCLNRGAPSTKVPKTKFAADSALEGTGFEPSVPRDTTNLSSRLWLVPANRKVGAKENRHTKVGPFPRGTDGSNPVPSSAESANHRFLSSRQAITCAGTYQRLQGRRVPVDTAIWHRKVRDNGRRYGREHRPADRWAPGPARLLFLPSYCRRSAPTLRSGSPRAASCRSLPR